MFYIANNAAKRNSAMQIDLVHRIFVIFSTQFSETWLPLNTFWFLKLKAETRPRIRIAPPPHDRRPWVPMSNDPLDRHAQLSSSWLGSKTSKIQSIEDHGKKSKCLCSKDLPGHSCMKKSFLVWLSYSLACVSLHSATDRQQHLRLSNHIYATKCTCRKAFGDRGSDNALVLSNINCFTCTANLQQHHFRLRELLCTEILLERTSWSIIVQQFLATQVRFIIS